MFDIIVLDCSVYHVGYSMTYYDSKSFTICSVFLRFNLAASFFFSFRINCLSEVFKPYCPFCNLTLQLYLLTICPYFFLQLCIQNNPNEARNMLLQNPQLAYALLQAQIVMKIVDPQVAMVRNMIRMPQFPDNTVQTCLL